MIDLEELIKTGETIKKGIVYVPAPHGVIRTFSEYKMQDHSTYSTWKNEVILFIENSIKDKGALERFTEQDNLFEKKNFAPTYFDNMLGMLRAYQKMGIKASSNIKGKISSTKVFIVHGHNEAINIEMARTIETLGLTPIILREQPSGSKTIIEKFEDNADSVGFSVILLTADDKTDGGSIRARQNVIFEMGYFMGKLGRDHVMCLLQDGVEKPGDIDGVVYTPLDPSGLWKFSLVKELKAAGYNVDANKIL